MNGTLRIVQTSSWPMEETCVAQVTDNAVATGVWSGSGLDEVVCSTLITAAEKSFRGHRRSGRVLVQGREYVWHLA